MGDLRPHGRVKYVVEKCRCTVCADDYRAYARWLNRQRAYGRERYTDATPVRAHIEQLAAFGIGLKRVGVLAGVSSGAMSKLMYGDSRRGMAPSKRVRPVTARKILAVLPEPQHLAEGARVDATGTRRRLQALIAIGFSGAELACRLGVTSQNFCTMLKREQVWASTDRAVRALYDDLWDKPPTPAGHRALISFNRARNQARAKGWPPPMAWDDDTIDDPTAEPMQTVSPVAVDEVVVDLCVAGRPTGRSLTRPERLLVAQRVLKAGQGASALARLLGCSGQQARHLVASAFQHEDERAGAA